MADSNVIKIDLEEVLRQRIPKLSKFIPRMVVEWMKRTICQDRLNEILQENAGLEGADFCRGALKSLDISVSARNSRLMPDPSKRRVIYVSNHPLGGLDGLALIDFVQRHHGGKCFFVVNDLLMAVKPLESVFLPVNKHGSQNRDNIRAIENAFAGDDPIIMFPAGMVSRLRKYTEFGKSVNKVRDLDWQKMFVNKAVEYKRDVIPLFFSGENSRQFYRMARLRQRLGIKFNFEMIYLPREMVRKQGSDLSVSIGQAIPWEQLTPGRNATDCARSIRSLVYTIDSIKLNTI